MTASASVTRLERRNGYLSVDAQIDPDPETTLTLRGMRVYPSGTTYRLVMPGTPHGDGNYWDAIVLPKPWRVVLLAAILSSASARGWA